MIRFVFALIGTPERFARVLAALDVTDDGIRWAFDADIEDVFARYAPPA